MTFEQFLKKNPRQSNPFWPGAEHTEPFGLRRGMYWEGAGASPGHLGTDRAGAPGPLLATFDMDLDYKVIPGSAAGSLTRFSSVDADVELQVFHAEADEYKKDHYNKSEKTPVHPGNLGVSLGVHTHTEGVCKMTPGNYNYVVGFVGRWFVAGGEVVRRPIEDHCKVNGMDRERTIQALKEQIFRWSIKELSDVHYVRHLPPYRAPAWRDSLVIGFDTKFFLDI